MLTVTSAPVVAQAPPSLFSVQSPWNFKPVKPVLGTDTVPAAKQTPWIEERDYACKTYRATASDGSVTIAVGDIANQLGGGVVTIATSLPGSCPRRGRTLTAKSLTAIRCTASSS